MNNTSRFSYDESSFPSIYFYKSLQGHTSQLWIEKTGKLKYYHISDTVEVGGTPEITGLIKEEEKDNILSAINKLPCKLFDGSSAKTEGGEEVIDYVFRLKIDNKSCSYYEQNAPDGTFKEFTDILVSIIKRLHVEFYKNKK